MDTSRRHMIDALARMEQQGFVEGSADEADVLLDRDDSETDGMAGPAVTPGGPARR